MNKKKKLGSELKVGKIAKLVTAFLPSLTIADTRTSTQNLLGTHTPSAIALG